ncbi:MAG: hypothetical protein WC716_16680 [Chitinophagaceae bacterium]|jgi:hypothetical protein
MATQLTARQSSQQATAGSGSLIRDVRPSDAYFIEPQLNIFGPLSGGPHINGMGKEVTSPKIIKTRQAKSWKPEIFTDENIGRNFVVTADAAANATTIYVSTTDAASILIDQHYQIAETGEDLMTTAAGNTGTGAVACEFSTGSLAVTAGMHILYMGMKPAETDSNLTYVLRSLDNHYNYCAQFAARWSWSKREENVNRYGGKTYTNDQKGKRREIMADIEATMFGSTRSATAGSSDVTTPGGLEWWAAQAGRIFDFGGSVEKSEIRQAGIEFGTYGSKIKICATSVEAMSVIEACMDGDIRVKTSELAEKCELPMAKKFIMGPSEIHFLPCQWFGQPGKEGQGVVFDADLNEIWELNKLELYEAPAGKDSTQSLANFGMWYYDGACMIPIDGGKHLVHFYGANQYAG